jgi:hypothetical protein
MALNIVNISYLLFRLAPIIIVSFFVFQSFLLWDLKGVIYLCGLLLSIGGTLLVDPFIQNDVVHDNKNPKCNVISLGLNGEYISKIPLNLVVYSYTFFYLLIFILNLANTSDIAGLLHSSKISQITINTALQQNIPILVFFPLLILVESFWIVANSCVSDNMVKSMILIGSGICFGGIFGVIWALMVTSLKIPQLQYIVSKNNDVCSRPSKTSYRCRTRTST